MSSTQTNTTVQKALETTTPFYQLLIDLEVFDKKFVHGVVTSLLSLTEEENCYLAQYHRAVLNVRSIIALNNVSHFQAVAMLARNLFELAVEVRMIEAVTDSINRMVAFQRLERLKAAKNAVAFAANHTLQVPIDLQPYQLLIATERAAIEGTAMGLFGSLSVNHWSGKNLRERCKSVGGVFEENYELLYKQLSWHVHPGLAGVVNVKPETFPFLYGISCQIAAFGFEEALRVTIKKFKVKIAIPTIDIELKFAKMRAHAAASGISEEALRKGLGLNS